MNTAVLEEARTIRRDEVVAYFDERNESELVVLP